MDQSTINDKALFHMSLILKAMKYKNDPKKMREFVKKNERYFPALNKQLEKLDKQDTDS